LDVKFNEFAYIFTVFAKKDGFLLTTRSAVKDGEYLATFRLEQIIQVCRNICANIWPHFEWSRSYRYAEIYVRIFGSILARADFLGL
jgi:hypothetical protein